MASPIWKKPPYYLKIFLYLYLNAGFVDSSNSKRGEVTVTFKELIGVCSSGRGGSADAPTKQCVRKALNFIFSEKSHVYAEGKLMGNGKVHVKFLKYDLQTNSKMVQETFREPSGNAEEKTTIIYNNYNIKNNNNAYSKVISKPAKKIKPTGFNNFKARERDYEAIKQNARLKMKNKAKEMEKSENR